MTDLNLKIKISGDSSQAEQSVGRVNNALRGLESSSSKFNSMMATIGVGMSAASLLDFVKGGIDAADALNDMADRSGIAVEKLAGLTYATKIGDTSLEAFIASSNKLSINIAKNAEDFAKLGVTAKDPVEAFEQFADVFSKIEDPQQRAALGAAAMGKSYAEMAPLLMMGANGVQALIDKGREHNPITTEQAQNAGRLNDRLTELGSRSQFAALVLSGPVVNSLNEFGDALGFAIEKSKGFHPLEFLTDYANGDSAEKKLGRLNLQIGQITQSIIDLKAAGVRGGRGFVATNIGELEAELAQLQKMRDALQPKPEQATDPAVAAFDAALAQKFIDKFKDEGAAAKEAESAVKALDNAYESTERSLRKEIALRGENSAAAQMGFEVQFGSLAKLDESRKLVLLNLAAEKDAVLANVQAYKEYDDIVEQGLALAGKQRAAQAENRSRLSEQFGAFNGLPSGQKGKYDDAFQARALNIIDDSELRTALENISNGLEATSETGKQTFSEMSQFAIQAAHNIQTSFADFIMSADEDFDELGANFAKTLARMAADAASAQLMDALLGKGFGTANAAGNGLIQAGFSAIGSFFGFADGGIMTGSGPLPLRTYAGGGVASSPQLALFGEGSMPEAYVPLPDGRSIPVTMAGGGGAMTVIIHNYGGAELQTKETDTADGKILEVIIDKRINQWAANNKRQGGLLV